MPHRRPSSDRPMPIPPGIAQRRRDEVIRLTGDSAIRRLDRDIPFPKKHLDVFEKAGVLESLDRFISLLRAPHMVELDRSYATGEINDDDLSDFIIMMPEFSESQRELSELARSMGENLGAMALDDVCRGDKNSVLILYSKIGLVIRSQEVLHVLSFRNTLIVTFYEQVIEAMTLVFIEAEQSGAFASQSFQAPSASVWDLVSRMNAEYLSYTGKPFPGAILYDAMTNTAKILELRKPDVKQFVSNGDFTEKNTPPEVLQQRADDLFREIFELANIAPVVTTEKMINGLNVRIVGNDDSDLQQARFNSLFFVHITFPPGKPLKISLNRHTGELTWVKSHTSIRHVFGPHYLRMKLRILEAIRAHLEDPSSIIVPPIIVRPLPVIPQSAPQNDEVEDIIAEDPEGQEDEQEEEVPPVERLEDVLFGIQADVLGAVVQTLAPEEVAAARTEYQEARTHLRGLRGSRTQIAIASLLGDPRPYQGSHRTYTGRDGSPAMIAIHPGKEVPGGLLRKFLKKVGVTIREFMDAY